MSESDPPKAAVALFGAPPRARQNASSLVAKLARQNEESMVSQLERLKEERAAGGTVLILDPDRVRYGALPNRDASRLTPEDPDMQDLVGQINEYRQLVPINVKPVTDDPAFDYEVVAGRRRVCACRILKAQLGSYTVRALLDDAAAADPKVEVVHAWLENDRVAFSAYETGRMFDGWIKAQIFSSQDDIAVAIRRKKATVSHYIGLYRLPPDLINAFPNVFEIPLRWGQELQRLYAANAADLTAKAEAIQAQKPRPDIETTFRLLTGQDAILTRPPRQPRGSSGGHSETMKRGGKKVFELTQKKGGGLTVSLGRVLKKQVNPKQQRELQLRVKRCVSDWVTDLKIAGLEDEE